MTPAAFLDAYGASAAAFVIFGVLHSVGAREPFKRGLARWVGVFFVDYFWRLGYCGLSLWALYSVVSTLHWGRNPDLDVWLIAYPEPLWQLVTLLHLGSITLVYVAFIQSDYLEFLGLRQAWRGVLALAGHSTRPPDLFGTQRLVISGVYAWVRHPMLAGGLLFLLTSGPSLNNLIYTGFYAAYMMVGGHFEERRMVRIFGADYRRYQQQVGAYVPHFRAFATVIGRN